VYASTGRNELALAQRSDGDVIVRRSDVGRPGDHGGLTTMSSCGGVMAGVLATMARAH